MDIQPRLAEWIFKAKLSPIRETFKEVKKDPSIMNLCIGDPYFNVPEVVSHAMVEAVQKGYTHYEDDTGMPALREAIIESENSLRGVSLHPYNNIVVSAGGVNAIFSVYHAIVYPGDEVLLLNPVWIPFIQITKMFNCKPVFVPTYFEDNFVPDWDQLEKLITKRTKILVVISPGNPTGAVYGEDTMKMFLRICEKYGLWLLHDEAYRDIVFHGHQQASMTGLSDNAIGIRTLSKSHAMTGIRVGWVLSSNEKLIDNVRKSIAYNVMCANTPAQHGALAAVKYGMEWLHNCVVEYQRRMEDAARRLRQMGLQVHWPMGSFYLFPKHPFKRNIAEEILEESRVAVIDGVHFGEFGKSHFRVSCCVSDEVHNEGLNRLEGWFRNRLGDHAQLPTE